MSGQTDFRIYLQTSSKELEKELRKISKNWNKESKGDFWEVNKLKMRFTDNWLGGKMLRGMLVRLGYELGNGKQTSAIFKPAAACEILHTALLIHDDIIDQSSTRRGKSAMHIHKNMHYGISQAICLGDLGISLSGKLIAESDFPQERKNQALAYFLTMVNQTILGEMMDVASALETKRTEKQILQIHQMKTANYTFVGPLTLGAMLAGATDEFIVKIENFAKPLGIAYQIHDDVLGIFGDKKTIGKSTTSDIEENKSTLLIAHAAKYGNKQQVTLLKKLYGKKRISKSEHEKIKKIFIDTGALIYSQEKITRLTKQAKKIIPLLSGNNNLLLLEQLCDFLLKRNV